MSPIKRKEKYCGTPYWLPNEPELSTPHGFQGLRDCDLYVYGLLVWSSFCLRGENPPARPRLQDALDDLRKLDIPYMQSRTSLFSPGHTTTDQVAQLLENTLVGPDQRDTQPWTYLYREKEYPYYQHREKKLVLNGKFKLSLYRLYRTRQIKPMYPPETHLRLSARMKSRYSQQSW